MNGKLFISGLLLCVSGVLMVVGGVGGILYTYASVVSEDITTPKDASIPLVRVGGPLTLKSQADVIRMHTMTSTGGKTFAQMPRTLPVLDESGNPVLDSAGAPITTSNKLRESWFNATTLITALHLGILTYAFSLLSVVLGILFVINGYVFLLLRNKTA